MLFSWGSARAGGSERVRWSERAAIGVCVVLALLLVWLLARLLWLLVPGEDPASTVVPRTATTDAPAAVAISRWHLFGDSPQRPGANRAAPATTLALSLRGTLADTDPRAGIAVIADEHGSERAWRVGDEVAAGVRLDEVHADHVVLLHEGAQEVLALRRDEPPPDIVTPIPAAQRSGRALRNTAAGDGATAPVTFVPPQIAHGRADWEQTMAQLRGSPDEVARRVQVVPVLDDGRIAGVRVSAAGGDAALLAQLGLRPSDIVTAVNGMPVDSVARGQQILESLGNANSVRVTVTRDGLPTEVTIRLR